MSDRMKRTLVIETEIDRQTLNESERIVKNFFDKHSDKKMKVTTPDFQEILQPIRDIEKEVARVTEKMPHMLGSIKMDQAFLADIKEAFSDIQVMFADDSVAKGFDEIIEKTKTLSIRSVDLGEFGSTLRKSAQETVDALNDIGAIHKIGSKKLLHVGKLDIDGLKQARVLVKDLVDIQQEMDDFNGFPLTRNDFYSTTTTEHLLNNLQQITQELQIIENLGLNDNQLSERRRLRNNIMVEAYTEDDFLDIKESASKDKEEYDRALDYLKSYIKQTEGLIDGFKNNTNLFSNDEFSEYTKQLTRNLNTAKWQFQQIQQIGGHNIAGDFSEVVTALNEIKSSLQVISDVFKNEDDAMRKMAENGVTSFTSLSEAIIAAYDNLSRLEELTDTISQKDFNITHVTTQASNSTSKRNTVKQLKAEVEAEMQHVKVLFEESDKLIRELEKQRMSNPLLQLYAAIGDVDEATGLPIPMTYDSFEKNIIDQMASAKTKAKIENVLVLIDGYITKMQTANKMRAEFGFGDWEDPFIKNKDTDVQPIIQHTTPQTSKVEMPTHTVEVDNTETQQMTRLKTAIGEVSKEIGRKNAGFIKEKEIVEQSVKAEVEQLSQLKNSIHEVSKAIGRKNAGFIKEQQVVATSVDAEKTKLRELITVLTNEIGGTLDNIKAKFEQSFAVPELDKNKLQASFDEVYNQFTELKDKIGTMQIDVGLNSKNITTAIQQALYAKEIERDFEKITFDDVFETDWFEAFEGKDKLTNRLTGEIVNSLDEAQEEFDQFFRGMWKDKNSPLAGDFLRTEQMIDRITHRMNYDEMSQDNWAQVIVEAINTQGNNIVEAINILLPKNLSSNDEAQLTDAFQILSREVSNWTKSTGISPGGFFDDVSNGRIKPDGNLKDALRTLGLISDTGRPQFVMPDTGVRNLGTAIADRVVVSSQRYANVPEAPELMRKIEEAVKLGASIPRMIGLSKEDIGFGRNAMFTLQERALGKNITNIDTGELNVSTGFLKATNEQIDRLLHTFEVMQKVGLHFDSIGDNILFDQKAGFSVLDLSAVREPGVTTNDSTTMVDNLVRKISRGHGAPQSEVDKFLKNFIHRAALAPDQRLFNSTTASEKTVQPTEKPTEVKLTPTMDEGAVAKVVEENVAKTPATVKVKPVVDTSQDTFNDGAYEELNIDYDDLQVVYTALDSETAIDNESQSAVDAAQAFIDAAKAKKQFVEANKKVAESAEKSAGAVKKEAEAAEDADSDIAKTASNVAKKLAKIKTIKDKDGKVVHTAEVQKFKTDDAIVTETTNKDENDDITSIAIIEDFEKLAAEAKKSEIAVAKAQAKLDEFLSRFKSKTGGNAQFVEGFADLDGTKVTADNIDKVFNKMTILQKKYSELEANFRKGQSSLNPFVNAINNSEKIGNIFADVEYKYNGLTNQTQDLVDKFDRLRTLSKDISDFSKKIKETPDSIKPKDFEVFSKQVGEFNVLKVQIEGAIKQQGRVEADNAKKQEEAYAEILRLVKERNDALAKAAKADDGSIKQKNALMDAYKAEQKLHLLGKQIVLTDKQRAELARIREEQARKIRDIEVDNKVKIDAQKATTREQKRKKEVEDYIKLIKQKNEYELKAAKGGAIQSVYNDKVKDLQDKIAQNDKRSIMNQAEKNKLLEIEEAHQRKIAELKAKQDSLKNFQKQNDTLKGKFDAGYLSEANFNKWQSELAAYQSYLDGTVKVDEKTIEKKKASLTQLYDQLNRMSNSAKTFFASGGEILPQWFNSEQIKNAEMSLRGLYAELAQTRFAGMETAIKNVNGEVGKLAFTVNDGEGHLSAYTIALNKSTGATKLLSGYTQDALTPLQQFTSALKGDIRGIFTAFIGGMSILHTVGNYIRDGIQAVRELDAALTELKKVTDVTEATYDRFLVTAAKTGERIGSTLSNVTSATAEFAKLGYNIEEAASMAEAALVYTNVGDNIDVETGSQSIISTLKAFGIEADNTMSIVDKFNEIGE